jgi:hypothetical protein
MMKTYTKLISLPPTCPSNIRWSADSVKLIFVTAVAFSVPGQCHIVKFMSANVFRR